jgi:cyclopropane fatty-acyl-phospholipid synthase-like methyltransferase
MAIADAMPIAERDTSPTVRTCYELLSIAPVGGVTDFTDGKYVDERNDRTAYLAAQKRQADYLLDQARCGPGTRLLDIGCGYGRILEHAAGRGADAVGITISPPQVASCRERGLNVHELNYRDTVTSPLLAAPDGEGEIKFDAIVANGSLEHFVQVDDAAAGRSDEIYQDMFAICRQLLVDGGRFVTTAIHFRKADQFDPNEVLRGPYVHPPRSSQYQFAILMKCFGGWYPAPGQLARCATSHFELVAEEDGTRDYHLTSEYWLRQLKRRLVCDPRVWWAYAKQLRQRPGEAWEMLRLLVWDQSWAWQFRPPAPLSMLRQTWVAK